MNERKTTIKEDLAEIKIVIEIMKKQIAQLEQKLGLVTIPTPLFTEEDLKEMAQMKKQYTYAKNIIQRNIDVFPFGTPKEKESGMYFKYRDPLTEGYNITPNFFISGIVDRQEGSVFNYKDDKLSPTKDEFVPNIHFTNRLFDRDTLVLQRYNINFLYVLSLYARNKNASRLSFRLKNLSFIKSKTATFMRIAKIFLL